MFKIASGPISQRNRCLIHPHSMSKQSLSLHQVSIICIFIIIAPYQCNLSLYLMKAEMFSHIYLAPYWIPMGWPVISCGSQLTNRWGLLWSTKLVFTNIWPYKCLFWFCRVEDRVTFFVHVIKSGKFAPETRIFFLPKWKHHLQY